MKFRTNTLMTLGASAIFGLAAVFLARSWINNSVEAEFQTVQAANQPIKVPLIRPVTKPVVVARSDFKFGDTLSRANLIVVDYPEEAIPSGAYSKIDDLLADAPRRVLLEHIARHEPILTHKISGEGGRRALSQLIAEGMRGVTIAVSLTSGVGGHVLPGDRVDILYLRNINNNDSTYDPYRTKTDVLFQNVKVLGVDLDSNVQSETTAVRRSVTFEVSNDQAQKLYLAQDSGQIILTLRRAGETHFDPQHNLDLNDLLAGIQTNQAKSTARTKKPAPVKAPKAEDTRAHVTVVRGDTRAQIRVYNESPNTDLAGG